MEIKNLNEYKFIISTGCSYGEILRSVFKPFNKINFDTTYNEKTINLHKQYGKNWLSFDNKIITIDLMIGSQSSDWQSDSIIEVTKNLLDLGVSSENIYCLVEWTQWSRYSTSFYYDSDIDTEKIKVINDGNRYIDFYDINTNLLTNQQIPINELFNKLKVRQSKNYYYIGVINDRFYLTPGHLNKKDFEELGKGFLNFFDKSKKIMEVTPVENKIKSYLNNILRTQYFLKSCGVKYNFYFMQCTLSNWYKGNKILYHNNEPNYIVKNDNIILNENRRQFNDPSKDIENVMMGTKNEVSKIDFSNFWLYENSKYRRSGIDEYAIDNFKEVGYITLHQHAEEFLNKFDIIPDYGRHPNFLVYLSLWNQISKNCNFLELKTDFVDFMMEKYWEDYNYDGFSKNNITISKKEWEKRFNQR